MSIKLFTPSTGLPDLEVKIAYGIARIGLEAFDDKKDEIFIIRNLGGYYEIEFLIEDKEFIVLDKTLNLVLRRLFSSYYIQGKIPGVTSKSKGKVTVHPGEKYSLEIYKSNFHTSRNKESENICKHKGNSIGNIIGISSSTSFHNSRDVIDLDKKKDKNSNNFFQRPTIRKHICKLCGLLALLGIAFSSFIMNIEDGKKVLIIPIPQKELYSSQLRRVFSNQHFLGGPPLTSKISQKILPLIFLSKLPSLVDTLNNFDLFLAVLSRPPGQGYHVDGLYSIPIQNYIRFLNQSPYNIATIDQILRSGAISSLMFLNSAVFYNNKRSVDLFARQYVLETSSDDMVNLLYPATVNYFLRRVYMIKEEILSSRAVRSIAKTLGYFIWQKDYQNYSFADGIRNAKTTKEVREILEKLMREAKLRYDQTAKEAERPNIPWVQDIDDINKLMVKKEGFDEVKAALYLLAFSKESYKYL